MIHIKQSAGLFILNGQKCMGSNDEMSSFDNKPRNRWLKQSKNWDSSAICYRIFLQSDLHIIKNECRMMWTCCCSFGAVIYLTISRQPCQQRDENGLTFLSNGAPVRVWQTIVWRAVVRLCSFGRQQSGQALSFVL